MRKNSVKSTRINAEVQRELSRIISSEVKDPRIHPFTTVTAVDVTTDLKYAKVYISVLGTKKDRESTIEGLKNSSGFIRSMLAKTVNLRNTPELTFISDDSIEYGINMSRKINDVLSADEEGARLAGRLSAEEEGTDEA